MKTGKRIAALLLALLMLAMAGCAKQTAEVTVQVTEASTEQATEAVTEAATEAEVAEAVTEAQVKAHSEDETIVIGSGRDMAPGEKTARYCNYILKVWEPLISGGQDGRPVGTLATEWSANEDYTEWTFQLRQGVKFHDGEDFNADAVIANVETWLKYPNLVKTAYTGVSFNFKTTYPGFQEIVKDGEYTVRFVFDKPVRTLDYYMTNANSAMYSPKCFEGTEEGDFNGLPQGTGPFKMTENVVGEYTVLERNEDYWGEKAGTKKVMIKVIPEINTRYSALKAEEIMSVADLGGITTPLAQELEKTGDFEIKAVSSTVSHYLMINHEHYPMSEQKMRQAVSLAIDRQMISDEFFGGYANATTTILSNCTPFVDPQPVEYNMEKAQELAKEVLGDSRAEVEIIIPSGVLDRYPYKEIAEYIQANLSQIGLDIKITILETAASDERRKNGDFDMVLSTQSMTTSEPYSVFQSRMHSEGSMNTRYGFHYFNQEAEDLINEVLNEMDMDKRIEIYNRLQEIAFEDMPMIPLVDDIRLIACNKQISGYEPGIYGEILENIHWTNLAD